MWEVIALFCGGSVSESSAWGDLRGLPGRCFSWALIGVLDAGTVPLDLQSSLRCSLLFSYQEFCLLPVYYGISVFVCTRACDIASV